MGTMYYKNNISSCEGHLKNTDKRTLRGSESEAYTIHIINMVTIVGDGWEF
jgi:hypothetical protein